LADFPAQDQARAHSLSLVLLFKPELIQEMSGQGGNGDPMVNIVYQIDGILGRLNIRNYSLDYFLTGVTVRLWAPNVMQRRPLTKMTLGMATKRLLEALDKKMTPQEHKHFGLSASTLGKVHDPVPGLPGMFTPDAVDSMVVTSSGVLEPGEDAAVGALFEEIFEAKKPKIEKESYVTPANIQGLSQNWQDSPEPQYESTPSQGLQHEKSFTTVKSDFSDGGSLREGREGNKELTAWFQHYLQGKWRWPLYSAGFNKVHQGSGCGELMLLQCDPFAAELGFQFLLQCAEGYAKEGTGQILIFSKKRGLGDIALSSLSRHYRGNPLAGKPAGGPPEASALSRAYDSLFPHAPQIAPCNRTDGLEQLLKYLEHDYLPKQRKRGNTLMPLAILIDNLDEFCGEDGNDAFRGLSHMKMRLREFNATLWVSRMGAADDAAIDPCLGLADYVLAVDHDGSRETARNGGNGAGGNAARMRSSEWEAAFHVDLPAAKLMQEVSLTKIRFQAHGSHRSFLGHYVYHRPSCLFKEINPSPQSASAQAPAPGASVAQSQQPG
jgi:hypothetical protein